MEEDKAAAYYDELTRKGGGAARFKQGLGFSSTTSNDPPPSKGSALPSSSSFMSNFVKASSSNPIKEENEIDKKTQIENIQNKLKKDPTTTKNSIDAPSRVRVRDSRRSRSRSRSRSIDRERERQKDLRRGKSRSRSVERRRGRSGGSDEERERSRRRYRSPSKERRRERSRERRRRRRSRSRSLSDGGRRHGRKRSFSPRDRRRSERGREGGKVVKKEGNGAIDYAKLIDGYDKMTPAERVKAKMKLQLSQTAEKDTKMGTDSQWERFDFNKDAPVDDAEIEAADDDAALVKQIGKSFRFTSLEGKKEDDVKNAHDEAMFGVPAPNLSYTSESEDEGKSENKNKETHDNAPASSLLNEKVLSKQQGSWRDRARRNVG